MTTSLGIVHPSIHIVAFHGGNPLAPLCSFTFSYIFRNRAVSSLFLSFICRHSHFLCPFSLYLKHLGLSSMTSCLLSSFTPHYITQLFNTSNLLPTTIFFFCSSPLLHFQAMCLNLPHFLQILPSLSSNSALNLARAYLLLSMSLMSLLY